MTYQGNFDVVIEGVGSERGARVMAVPEGLYVNEHQVPYTTLLGVALRGSILLVVGTQVAMALRGSRDGLAALAAELRGRADLNHLPISDREALKDERVVFATPVALSGLVGSERYKGMVLAVVTDSTLHVFERGGRQFRIPWNRVTGVDIAKAKFGRLLRLASGRTRLEFLYLTDAQIQTMRGLISRHSEKAGLAAAEPPPVAEPRGVETAGVAPAERVEEAEAAEPAAAAERAGAVKEGGARAAEAAAAEAAAAEAEAAVAPEAAPTAADHIDAAMPELEEIGDPTRHFTIPEFELSLGAIGSGSDRPLGAAVNRLQMSPLLPVGFLEEHLRELRTVFDGALLRRKREASSADVLFAAAEALDGRKLWDDIVESVAIVADATLRGFERQTRRIAADRRIPWRKVRGRFIPSAREVAGLRRRLARGVIELEGVLDALSKAAEALAPAARASPAELRRAYDRWLERLKDLDQAYAAGWVGLSREVIGVWQDVFLPRLIRLGGERRRLLPRPVRVAVYFLIVVLLGAAVYLYLTGRLGEVLPFR